jgi:hypothetical protein
MTDLLLNPCGDIDITDGRLTIVRGADAVRQRWLIYIRTFLGEWFLNTSIGVPYIQRLFKKQLSRQTIKQIFTAATLEVPGILQVVSVIVDELNVVTRFVEVTVTCIINGDEGPETGQFKYTGTIPADGCGALIEVPPTIDDLLIWFDAMAPDYFTYAPGNLVMQNRAGAGYIENAGGGSADVKVLSYSPLNGRPAMRFRNNPAGADFDEYMQMVGVPALRDTTGYNGDFVAFIVSKFNTGWSPTAADPWLWALDGSAGSSPYTREFYTGFQALSGPPYKNPGDGGLGIRSEVLGAVEASPLTGTGTVTPAVNDADPSVRAWHVLQQVPPSKDRILELNDAVLLSSSGTKPDKRLLNGAGLIGAGYDANTGNPDRYFDGYIGEYLLYGRALTAVELQAVTDYLLAKWNIPASI